MRLKYIRLLLLIGMVVSLTIPFSTFAVGKGKISLTDAQGKEGDEITVDVSLSENPGLISANLYVNYDGDLLQLTKVDDAGLLPGKAHGSDFTAPYCLSWVNDLSTENFTATGKLVTLYFKVAGSTASETKISVEQDIIDKDLQSVFFETEPCSVIIAGGKKNETCSEESGNSERNTGGQDVQSSHSEGEQQEANGGENNSSRDDATGYEGQQSNGGKNEAASGEMKPSPTAVSANGEVHADGKPPVQGSRIEATEDSVSNSESGSWIWVIVAVCVLTAGLVAVLVWRKRKQR